MIDVSKDIGLGAGGAYGGEESDVMLSEGLGGLGERLRAERLARGLTLDAAAGLTGVSKAMLSAVERGKRVPTIRILVLIAEGYGSNVSSLMAGPVVPRVESRAISVLRSAARTRWADPVTGVERELLAPAFLARNIEVLRFSIPAGRANADLPPRHVGVLQHVTVISGRLRVVAGEASVSLQSGDCACFAADVPHGFFNEGVQPCDFFLVMDTASRSA